ncbi:MAG: squalene/phytoene synthase family protein [Sutterellaceae bacterium]|nr:squalene/phytoene synthase family protein [Sutterellaceae bacterium]
MAGGPTETIPVASLRLLRRLRPAVKGLYRFARHADDLTDEGSAPPAQRALALRALHAQLDAIERAAPSAWPDLAAAVRTYRLPLLPLRDLLSAFEQDLHMTRYANYASLLDYCRRSANPIGRLLRALFGCPQPALVAWSDAICPGLQLIRQDIALDYCRWPGVPAAR